MQAGFNRDRRGPANLAVLCFGALLIGLFLALPFAHELFHEHGEAEPENCPACMIESSPVLLVVVILPLLFVSARTRIRRRRLPGPSPLPLFFRGYSFANRAPPRS